jgi:hypothetical protein
MGAECGRMNQPTLEERVSILEKIVTQNGSNVAKMVSLLEGNRDEATRVEAKLRVLEEILGEILEENSGKLHVEQNRYRQIANKKFHWHLDQLMKAVEDADPMVSAHSDFRKPEEMMLVPDECPRLFER